MFSTNSLHSFVSLNTTREQRQAVRAGTACVDSCQRRGRPHSAHTPAGSRALTCSILIFDGLSGSSLRVTTLRTSLLPQRALLGRNQQVQHAHHERQAPRRDHKPQANGDRVPVRVVLHPAEAAREHRHAKAPRHKLRHAARKPDDRRSLAHAGVRELHDADQQANGAEEDRDDHNRPARHHALPHRLAREVHVSHVAARVAHRHAPPRHAVVALLARLLREQRLARPEHKEEDRDEQPEDVQERSRLHVAASGAGLQVLRERNHHQDDRRNGLHQDGRDEQRKGGRQLELRSLQRQLDAEARKVVAELAVVDRRHRASADQRRQRGHKPEHNRHRLPDLAEAEHQARHQREHHERNRNDGERLGEPRVLGDVAAAEQRRELAEVDLRRHQPVCEDVHVPHRRAVHGGRRRPQVHDVHRRADHNAHEPNERERGEHQRADLVQHSIGHDRGHLRVHLRDHNGNRAQHPPGDEQRLARADLELLRSEARPSALLARRRVREQPVLVVHAQPLAQAISELTNVAMLNPSSAPGSVLPSRAAIAAIVMPAAQMIEITANADTARRRLRRLSHSSCPTYVVIVVEDPCSFVEKMPIFTSFTPSAPRFVRVNHGIGVATTNSTSTQNPSSATTVGPTATSAPSGAASIGSPLTAVVSGAAGTASVGFTSSAGAAAATCISVSDILVSYSVSRLLSPPEHMFRQSSIKYRN
eukprot:CAMPEP_0176431818 /NCGR_PEP_ID=MMETSP0127-20121128/15028_1 /TAXON_ID=938130 /ORGANISM="Platyophrya macrostoma, Strain WH" /LENGTH=704 /DNA_ID=CAMNT_0017813877 /DNA_START=159 /DNA_END=2271 /DNA_ORIENTATION=-